MGAATRSQPKLDSDITPEWIAKVQALKPDEQVNAVLAKMQQFNTPSVGFKEIKIDADGVKELTIDNMPSVSDISPLAALSTLEKLDARGGKVKEITALQKLKKLRVLNIDGNPIVSLAPLKALPLEELTCSGCAVPPKLANQWLAPLSGLNKLHTLNCSNE
jgi:Leucine-rich repeat (LRR) protein